MKLCTTTLILFSGLAFYGLPLQAIADTNPLSTTTTNFFPLMPRLTALGLAGTNELVNGDGMAALMGNDNTLLYLDGQGKTAFETDWSTSLGTGVRTIQDNKRILGAYVFADRDVSTQNKEYWFLSPGLESMGQQWDFRVNGYVPVSNSQKTISTGFADQFGNYNYVSFSGHTQYDAIITNTEEVGWGADAEVGRSIPKLLNMRVYAGGYHFNFDNADPINGVAGRIEVPFNSHLTVTVRDSYDNFEHNTFMAGLELTLGGVNKAPQKPDQPIYERLLDPVQRNMATLGKGTAEPVKSASTVVAINNQIEQVERDNIWFFSPTASGVFDPNNPATSCTFSNTCASSQLTQQTIDIIDAHPAGVVLTPVNPSYYLAPGDYDAFTSTGSGADVLNFTNANIFGRSANFVQTQQGAVLNGGLGFFGFDSLNSLIVLNEPTLNFTSGVSLHPGSEVIINNSIIGAPLTGLANSLNLPAQSQSYTTAIEMVDSTLIVENNSQINAFSNTAVPAVGIESDDTTGSVIDVDHSQISALSTGNELPNGPLFDLAAGIITNNQTGSTINLNASTIDAVVNENFGTFLSNPAVIAAGIISNSSNGTDTINLGNLSTILVNNQFSATGSLSIADGLLGFGQGLTAVVNNSQITATTQSFAGANSLSSQAFGVFALGNSTITLTNNAIVNANVINTAANLNASVAGLFLSGDTDTAVINHSTINATTTDNTGTTLVALTTGIQSFGTTANILVSNHSTINATINAVAGQTLDAIGISTFNDTVNLNITGGSTVNSINNGQNANTIQADGIDTNAVNSTIDIDDSSINASVTNAETGIAFANGIVANGGPITNTTLNNSRINATILGNNLDFFVANGIVTSGDTPIINLTGSAVNATITGQNGNFQATGIASQGTTTTTINAVDSTASAQTNIVDGSSLTSTYLTQSLNLTSGDNIVNLTNSQLIADTTANTVNGIGAAYGINAEATNANLISLDHSQINVTTSIVNYSPQNFSNLLTDGISLTQSSAILNNAVTLTNNSVMNITSTITNDFNTDLLNGQVNLEGIVMTNATNSSVAMTNSSINGISTISNGAGINKMASTGIDITSAAGGGATVTMDTSSLYLNNALTNNGIFASNNAVAGMSLTPDNASGVNVLIENGSALSTNASVVNTNASAGDIAVTNDGIAIFAGTNNVTLLDTSTLNVNAAISGTLNAGVAMATGVGVQTFNGANTTVNGVGNMSGAISLFGVDVPFVPVLPP